MSEAEESDRVTQAAEAIDQLLEIMNLTMKVLSRGTGFKEMNPEIPETVRQRTTDDINMEELALDFVSKAKEIEKLIDELPSPNPDEDYTGRFLALEKDLMAANKRYTSAMERATNLHGEVKDTLAELMDARQKVLTERP